MKNSWVFNALQTELWDSNAWAFILIVSILCGSMMIAHMLKKLIPALNKMLIPASVLGGIIVLIFTTIYQLITKDVFFDLPIFSLDYANNVTGTAVLETITYHCLGIGFVAMGLRQNDKSKSKVNPTDVFNTGVTTVATYLIQAIFGLVVTILLTPVVDGLIDAAGIILCLGFGQGTGQAMNFGKSFADQVTIMPDYFLRNGKDFGLAIAALGFLAASIGGVIYLNILKRQGKIQVIDNNDVEQINPNEIQEKDEIGMNESMDKFTVQLAFVFIVYAGAYGLMHLLKSFFPGNVNLQRTVFGFNFLLGTLLAVVLKAIFKFLKKKGLVKRRYLNNFMLNRIGGVAFDIMIVAGIAAINLYLIRDYWWVLLILGAGGTILTFAFIHMVSKKLHPTYKYEQFFAMYGMLTGTASTGMILLREIDPKFETPASDNLVYQNLPAIVFGFPIMMLIQVAQTSRENAILVLFLIIAFLAVLLTILFRKQIFKKRKKKEIK